jgi:hypothetical protein
MVARSLLLAASVLSLAACASGTVETSEPDATERAALVDAVGDDVAFDGATLDELPKVELLSTVRVARPAWPLTRALAGLLHGWSVVVTNDCVEVAAGSADADGDGVPVLTSFTLSCSSPTGSAFGVAYVTDIDDAEADTGYALAFDALHVKTVAGDVTTTRIVDGSFVVRKDVATGAVDVVRDLTLSVTRAPAVGVARSATVTLTGSTDIAGGQITSAGRMRLTERGVAHVWRRATAGLAYYSVACRDADPTGGFDAGNAVYTDERANTLRVAFTGCGQRVLTLNGNPL